MKRKIKLIPGVLLLVLCLGILGVGIYAAKPASNTITGTVTVNAANTEVSIAVYDLDDYEDYDPVEDDFGYGAISSDTNRVGSTLTLSYGNITLDGSNANNTSDVPEVTKVFVIKNNSTSSTSQLGAYFWNRDTESNVSGSSTVVPTTAAITASAGTVTATDILYGDQTTHYGASSLNGILKINYPFYSHLAPEQTIVMFMTFSLASLTETSVNAQSLNLSLNIEPYVAQTTLSGFVKLAVGSSLGSYDDNESITNFVIPYGVTSIDDEAFYYCTKLTSVTIPSSVTSIGGHAFGDCIGLTSVNIQNSVIGDSMFYGCTGLTSVTIPSGVTSIGREAFNGCTGLTSVTIPGGVTSVGAGAFRGCTGLTSVNIQNSVLGEGMFYDCTGLTSVTIPSSVTTINGAAFHGCTGLTSVTIPSSVTSVGAEAFRGCTGLTRVTIPSSVTTIRYNAFRGCTGLTTANLYLSSNTIKINSEDDSWFFNCSSSLNIHILSSLSETHTTAFGSKWHYRDNSTPHTVTADLSAS